MRWRRVGWSRMEGEGGWDEAESRVDSVFDLRSAAHLARIIE